jgi:hypothetical protein
VNRLAAILPDAPHEREQLGAAVVGGDADADARPGHGARQD